MLKEKMEKKTDRIHPEEPSAVGSRNSLYRDGRDEYKESSLVIDEEIDKILNHVSSKLPPELLNKIDVMGGIKDKLHNFYNQNLQNMQNRYLVTAEDEILKRYRDLIDREELKQLNRYTPVSLSDIMEKIGGEDRFNTYEIDKSIASIYQHLQGHLQRGIKEFENNTNTLLRQKNDVGSFIRKENAYAIVKCSFKNNSNKPQTVMDVKLAINILHSELITSIYHYQKPLNHLLKEIISKHIHVLIDQSVEKINAGRMNEGKKELGSDQRLLEKLTAMENYFPFDEDLNDEKSKRYDFIAKRFLDSLEAEDFELPAKEFEVQNIRENVKHILDEENVQNRGFNKVVNALTTILDNSKLGYQYIDNLKNARLCVIREYALKNKSELPDEVFAMRLSYLDHDQLIELRKVYDLQFSELAREIEKAGLVVEKINSAHRKKNNIKDYRSVSQETLNLSQKKRNLGKKSFPHEEKEDLLWSELTLMSAKIEKSDQTTKINKSNLLKQRISLMKGQILEIYGNQYPEERLTLDGRIIFLEENFQSFASMLNPHHIQQGLVLEVDITSVKRRQTTLESMSSVLNEFILQVSKGFVDQGTAKTEALVTEKIEEESKKKFTSVLQSMDKSLEEVEA